MNLADRLDALEAENRALRDGLRVLGESHRAVATEVARSRRFRDAGQWDDLKARLDPGPLVGTIRHRRGAPERLPDLGAPLTARLRDDAAMGAYAVGRTDAFGGYANLLVDPTFETFSTTAVTIGTSYTSVGDEWEAKYVLNSGTVATVRQMYEATAREEPGSVGSSSVPYLYLEFGTNASDMTIYLRSKDVTEVLSTENAIASWIVAACRVWGLDTGTLSTTIDTFTATLELVDGSDTVLDSSDSFDLLQSRTDNVQALLEAAHEGPAFGDDHRWRLRIDITRGSGVDTGYAIMAISEPLIAMSDDGSPPSFTPAIARWEPSHVRNLTAEGLVRLIGTTATTQVLGARDDGDSDDRLTMDASGKIGWGSGSGAADVNLYRLGANRLGLEDAELEVIRDAAGNDAINAYVTGDSASRYLVNADGSTEWGPGSGSRDVRLQRTGAGEMTLDNNQGGGAADEADLVLRDLTATGDLDVAGVTTLSGLLALGGIVRTAPGSNQNDWAPTGISTATIIIADPSASIDVTGIAAGDETDGRVLILINENATNTITLKSNSASSTSVNRIHTRASSDQAVGPREGIMLIYDSDENKWRPLSIAA